MDSQTAVAETRGTAGPPAEERRASARYAADLDAACRAVAAARPDAWRARVFNISAAGVGLVLGRRVEPGTLLALDLPNPASGCARTLMARIIHATPGPGGTWLVGGSFLRRLDADVLRAWSSGPARPGASDPGLWVRFPPELLALCRAHGAAAEEPWRARVLDVSPGGLSLIAPSAIMEGTYLAVDLAADGPAARGWLVRVAQREAQPDGAWLLACDVVEGAGGEVPEAPRPAAGAVPEGPGGPRAPAAAPGPAAAADSDLARLCTAWPALRGPVKAAILALVAAGP
jgi:hypothetical protein